MIQIYEYEVFDVSEETAHFEIGLQPKASTAIFSSKCKFFKT